MGGLSPCVRGYRLDQMGADLSAGSIPVCTGLPPTNYRIGRSGWVYPRVYGATCVGLPCAPPGKGLSPCVRGYQLGPVVRPVWMGSIPVCTGLPPRSHARPRPERVYPRVYGATRVDALVWAMHEGLSPCVRGYRKQAERQFRLFGSIPVCTGLPKGDRPGACPWRVYPRVYGATYEGRRSNDEEAGLSPCVRGYQMNPMRKVWGRGSIPVCTGLPDPAKSNPSRAKVYPRVYGATAWWGPSSPRVQGLSPCVRGYRRLGGGARVRPGSIPVCTGLPGPRHGDGGRTWVYPRVYGATPLDSNQPSYTLGLSPCVRGYRVLPGPPSRGKGSIPVCTGLPSTRWRTVRIPWVYPRVYGATSRSGRSQEQRRGLSPCVRGYPDDLLDSVPLEGSIPVCTGLPSAATRRRGRRWVYPRVYGAT